MTVRDKALSRYTGGEVSPIRVGATSFHSYQPSPVGSHPGHSGVSSPSSEGNGELTYVCVGAHPGGQNPDVGFQIPSCLPKRFPLCFF